MAKGDPITAIARDLGISPKTVRRHGAPRPAQERIEAARQTGLTEAVQKLSERSLRAVEVLAEVMEDREESAGARITAAKAILEQAVRLREHTEFDERLRRLEGAQHTWERA